MPRKAETREAGNIDAQRRYVRTILSHEIIRAQYGSTREDRIRDRVYRGDFSCRQFLRTCGGNGVFAVGRVSFACSVRQGAAFGEDDTVFDHIYRDPEFVFLFGRKRV